MKILICTNPSRDIDGSIAQNASRILDRLGVEVAVCLMTAIDVQTRHDFDMLLVLGGDGTILRAAQFAVRHSVPLLGVNLGRVGYLSAFNQDKLESGLVRVVNGEFRSESRLTLEIDGQPIVNEAVVYRGLHPRPISVLTEILANGKIITRKLRGDGLIIATPTGSTAYSKFAGGTVLDAQSDRILFTPICAESSTPEVLNAVDEIRILVDDESFGALSIDGQTPRILAANEIVTIRVSEKRFSLVKLL